VLIALNLNTYKRQRPLRRMALIAPVQCVIRAVDVTAAAVY